MYDADEHNPTVNTAPTDPLDLSSELGFIQYLSCTAHVSPEDGRRLAAAGQKIQEVLDRLQRSEEKHRRAWLLNMRHGSTVYWRDPLRVESGYYSLDLENSEWKCHHDTSGGIEEMEFVITAPFDPQFEQVVSAHELFPDDPDSYVWGG